jgi:tetratricopeptide (TPR) repeat protein
MNLLVPVLVFTISAQCATPAPGELSRQASMLLVQGRFQDAEPLLRQAIAGWTQVGPEASLNRGIDKRSLGSLLRATARYREAEAVLEDSLVDLEAARADAGAIAHSLFHLSAVYRNVGNLTKAEAMAVRAAGLLERAEGKWDAERQRARLILGSVYVEQRRWEEAEFTLLASLKGADGAAAVAAYSNLATVAIARMQYGEAEENARRALQFARLALAPTHPTVATTWNNLAQALRFQGQYLEAERAYREAIGIWEEALGSWHPDLAKGLMNLGSFYHERGREAGAEDLYNRAAAIFDKAFGKDDPRTLIVRNELADVLRAQRRYTESEKLGRATLVSLQRILEPDDPRVTRALTNHARLLAETRREDEAVRISNSLRPPH